MFISAILDCWAMEDPGLNPALLRQALVDHVNSEKRAGTKERALLTSIAIKLNEIARENKMDGKVSMQTVQNWISNRPIAKEWCYPVRVFLGLGRPSAPSADPIVARLDQILHVLTMVLAAASRGVSDAVEQAKRLPEEPPKKIKRAIGS